MYLAEAYTQAVAQHAAVADRCAHEIVPILACGILRLRRLSGNPLGGNYDTKANHPQNSSGIILCCER
jgi:hypothetical protein